MQRAHIPLLAAILVALFAGLAASPGVRAQNANDRVGGASVIDGDTLEIHGRRIRLDGVDAPERGRRCGDVNVYQRAAQALDSFVEGRTVLCTVSGPPDRYGREIAQCSVAGASVNEFMVAQGWARDWRRYSGGAYADEEAQARANRRGLWGLACPADLWGNRNYN